jgi:hypothetical protein
MTLLQKILRCYPHNSSPKSAEVHVRTRYTKSSRYLSEDRSTSVPSHDETGAGDSPGSTGVSQDEVFERMKALATRRRYDGVHVRKGSKLVLNIQ